MMSSLFQELLSHSQETCNPVRIPDLFTPYYALYAAEAFRSLSPEPDTQRVDGTVKCLLEMGTPCHPSSSCSEQIF